jgi:regulation of enolase protein 1 (concanavalin A-like superfamily)
MKHLLQAVGVWLMFVSPWALGAEWRFEDDFQGALGEGWFWVREHRQAWRVTPRGLEVRVEPGNMWGAANDARNVLVRTAPDPTHGAVEVAVTVENRPTEQYEQVDLVWYYDDSHMVKLGQELVDGKLSVVMGREEADRTRTIAILPLESFSVRLRLIASGHRVRGQFRPADEEDWRDAGECDLPVHGAPKVSLQFYQGPAGVEHWARVTEFRLRAAGASEAARLPKVRLAADGRAFETAVGQPFVPFGVTYFRPGTGWAPQVWKQFDAEATRHDFARMKALGVNCARVFLTFGSFYSTPGALAEDGLAKFDQFLDLAEQAGLYVHPTGPDHWEGLPDWARGDRYADERVLGALETFWKLFAARYRGRAAIFAYDLLNEPEIPWDTPALREQWNQWLRAKYQSTEALASAWNTAPQFEFGSIPVPPPADAPGSRQLLDFQHFREHVADEWTRRQAAAIKAADPDALVTVGLIQWSVPALLPAGPRHYSAFRPERQAKFLDFLEVHFYPLEHGAYEYRDLDSERRNLAYLESVVREVAKPGRPVVLGEFGWYGGGQPSFGGGRHPAATESQQARWCRRVVETTRGLVCGWLNWGFYDHPEAKDVTELIGLVKPDGTLKEWGREFKRLAGELAVPAGASARAGQRPALDWDACLTSAEAGRRFREAYYQSFNADQP